MTATRSIVTSMGFFIQKLLISWSESAESPPEESGWDAIKTTSDIISGYTGMMLTVDG